jgi:hypothetical protein
MPLIIHRCRACTHPDYTHLANGECSWGHCRAGRHKLDPGPSEYLATYHSYGTVTTRVAIPGEPYQGFGLLPVTTCGCDECWTLYRSLHRTAS